MSLSLCPEKKYVCSDEQKHTYRLITSSWRLVEILTRMPKILCADVIQTVFLFSSITVVLLMSKIIAKSQTPGGLYTENISSWTNIRLLQTRLLINLYFTPFNKTRDDYLKNVETDASNKS